MTETKNNVIVRPLEETDLPEADRILRLAFGTFLGLPDLSGFLGDADYVRTRWLADSAAAFAAEIDGELAGSNFVSNWGSVGFFGPLTVRPDLWNRGIGKRLMEPIMERFAEWEVKLAGLFTLPTAPDILTYTRSMASGRVFLPQSCLSLLLKQRLPRNGLAFGAARKCPSGKPQSLPGADRGHLRRA